MAGKSRIDPVTGIFATDMDGTLHKTDCGFHSEDISALETLGRKNIIRVVATGRSFFSFNRMMGEKKLPLDYVILSSGARIQDYKTGDILKTEKMNETLTTRAVDWLHDRGYDYCLQSSIPGEHVFAYSCNSGSNPDIDRRIALYEGNCRPLRENDRISESTQLVIIVPPDYRNQDEILAEVMDSLGESYNILRTTSPLDGESMWIEIFPAGVSKRSGVEWLAAKYNLTRSDVAAVGNDYNDHDLLEWAGHAFVVRNSPEHLRTRFREVPAVGEGGVAEAVRLWLEERRECQ